jgi:hypothetical protein
MVGPYRTSKRIAANAEAANKTVFLVTLGMFPRRSLRFFSPFSVSAIGERGADAACRCRTMVDVIAFNHK